MRARKFKGTVGAECEGAEGLTNQMPTSLGARSLYLLSNPGYIHGYIHTFLSRRSLERLAGT